MLKKKIVPILCYALSAVLIAGYVAVLLIKPNVPEEYRMLYIDHLLSEWCGIDGLNYTLGTEVTYNNSGEQSSQFHNLGDGWSKREAKFTWTDSSTAYLYFRPQCESCELKITITCTILSDFDLYINDLLVGSSSELSVKKTAKQYGGDFSLKYENGMAIATFIIPNKKS